MKLSLFTVVFSMALLASGTAYAACNANIPLIKPNSIYAVHGDGTVTDVETGLMWQQCSLGLSGPNCATGTATATTWKAALEAAQTANGGAGTLGYTDWRLPSVAELRTLFEEACYDPAVNTAIFPATVIDLYWSASPYAGDSGYAWGVGFGSGGEGTSNKYDNGYVRLVRGGY